MITTTVQRWRARRDRYRPAGELIRTSAYEVAPIALDTPAKAFVSQHHYSGTFPAARFRFGLYRSAELVGVAVFSVPASPRALDVLPCEREAGVELGRFVLLDDVPGNGETWFLARAFRALRAELPEVRTVLSYSDPMPRAALDGRLVTPGHVGIIYQAFNGRHVGRSRADAMVLDRDGRTVGRRGLSKLRNGERGAGAVYRRLLDAGAPPRLLFEDDAAYVERALREGPFRHVRHPGNLAYVWAVDRAAAEDLPPALAYPRRAA